MYGGYHTMETGLQLCAHWLHGVQCQSARDWLDACLCHGHITLQ